MGALGTDTEITDRRLVQRANAEAWRTFRCGNPLIEGTCGEVLRREVVIGLRGLWLLGVRGYGVENEKAVSCRLHYLQPFASRHWQIAMAIRTDGGTANGVTTITTHMQCPGR